MKSRGEVGGGSRQRRLVRNFVMIDNKLLSPFEEFYEI